MSQLDIIQSKILDRQSLKNQLAVWRFLNKKIIFSNGCFDILHLGHIDYLSKASDFGDVLIIGLNTDNSVRKLKGNNRPINDEKSRAMILASLQFVTAVILFDEDTPYDLIKFVQPDILVKGSDYLEEDIVGFDIVKAKGGEVKIIDLVPDISTTIIENRIKK